jgi:D-glycero-alpha-D-manno-heptose-7-phosphate kinase
LYAYRGSFCSKEKLARKACEIEIGRLKEPIGKQDQYAAAYGGMNFIEFVQDGTVVVTPMILPADLVSELENNLLLFFTGMQRSTKRILEDQTRQVKADGNKMKNLSKMVELAYEMREKLMNGDLHGFAESMHDGWMLKRTLSSRISKPEIDKYYNRALEYGAVGGKLLGAGGGGFLLLYCEKHNQERLRKALFDLYELPFKFDHGGARIIYVGERHTKRGFFY